MDMWFTSVIVARLGLEKRYAIVGRINLGRKEIPKELKSLSNKREKSTSFHYAQDENIMFVLYIDKKLSGKKNVMVLTNMHDSVRVPREKRSKPDVHVLYYHTKGGVDVADLSASHNSTRMKHKRWPVNALASLLDTVRTNAKTILAESTSKVEYQAYISSTKSFSNQKYSTTIR